jgi:hypothetical protein
MIPVTDLRNCEQCGTPFVPRRQHARFCSARCRASWNREHKKSDPAIDASALAWSMTAMRDATGRLPRVRAGDPARAFAAIAEAVWWVTIVDATLVRHHLEAYDRVLASQPTAERRQIEGMLAGLRFVRNGMGLGFDHADFIRPEPRRPGSDRARVASAARAGVGDNTVPGIPGPACRSRHRGHVRASLRVPQPGCRQRGPQARASARSRALTSAAQQ